MPVPKRKPGTVGEILREEFMEPLGLTQQEVADAMGVSRRLVNELCNDRRGLTTETAIMLGIAFGTSHEFWLNIQANAEAWEVHNIPRRRERIAKAHPIAACAV